MSILSLLSPLFASIRSGAATLHSDHGDDPPADPPISIDADGWAHGEGVEHFPSVRSQKLATVGAEPIGIVSHWTATGPGTGRPTCKRIRTAPAAGEHSASWHVWITRDGSILQSVSFRRGAWHVGGASSQKFMRSKKSGDWVASSAGDVSGNALFVGVEFEVVGEVRQVGGKWMGWPFGRDGKKGPVVDERDVVEMRGRHYHTFTDAQERAARRLWTALVREYPIDLEGASWGHRDLDPSRKSDPGPVWSEVQLPRVLAVVFGGQP